MDEPKLPPLVVPATNAGGPPFTLAPQRRGSQFMHADIHAAPHGSSSRHDRSYGETDRDDRETQDVDMVPVSSLSEDDTSSISSASTPLDLEANYAAVNRSTDIYRYPPILPDPAHQHRQQYPQASPPLRRSSENFSGPPNISSTQSSERHPDTCGIIDRSQRNSSRASGSSLEWLVYAEEVRDETGATHYQCLWRGNGRLPTACDYRAQKQAMKRHVEATHLKFKPHRCAYCPRAYSQKTALEVHEATHTGATPHECQYNCGKAFSDPARRYRHHVDVHNYVPRQSNKKHRNAQMRMVRGKERHDT